MKNYFFYTLTALLLTQGWAQEKRPTNADKKYQDFHYLDAAAAYEREVRKGDDTQVTLEKLGDAYYNNNDMAQAAQWYGQLFSKYERTISPAYIFKYILALKGVGNYALAKALMKAYEEQMKDQDFKVAHFQNNDEALDVLRNQQPQFVISHLSINTPYADFGPMFHGEKIVFASSRDSMNLHTRLYEWNEQPFLNLYEADTVELGSDLIEIRRFGNDINTKYHEAITTFNEDGTQLYFTRNNYTEKDLGRDGEGTNHLKMYHSRLEGAGWSPPAEVSFNSADYSVGQPALSPDGSKMYFVSDMPNGMGGPDLYVVSVREDGSFGEPKNLGANINTSGREMFPFVTEEKLYFASDGHLGLGGLDVFEVTISETLGIPSNLGPVLNGPADDFAYIVEETSNRGYFSSNRAGGDGDDDIYSFHRLERQCTQLVQGTVLRKANDNPVANATVALYTDDGETLSTGSTDAYGAFIFDTELDCISKYRIAVTKEGYEGVEADFTTSNEPGNTNEVSLIMTKALNELIVMENGVLKIKIDNIYFDLNKADIRPDAAQELDKIVEVLKEYPKMVIKIEAHTDSRGSDRYNEKLSDRRAKSTGAYITGQGISTNRIESAIGYGEKQLLNHCSNGVRCSNTEHDRNRRSEFIVVTLE
ncbi:MAG: OmpA family protein [Bacteroidota bacterium]